MSIAKRILAGLSGLALLGAPAARAAEPAAAAVGPAVGPAVGAAPGAAQRSAALDQAYPAGTIASEAQADQALAAANEVHRALQAEYDAQRADCAHYFLLNRCLAEARASLLRGDAVVQRVTLEAHDLRRHAEARRHDEARAQELRKQAREDALRPQREREALAATQARAQNAAQRAEDERRDAAAAQRAQASARQRLQTQQASEAHAAQLRPGQEAAAQEAYQRKREDAAAYAESKAQDKKVNVEKRAQRQLEREARNREDAQRAAKTEAGR